jgi:hypothetical protein
MMTMSMPYMQRVRVPSQSLEEAYKTIVTWLQYNNWSITSSNRPTIIEARFNADIQMFQVGPQDNFPKNMSIRLSEYGGDVMLDITITQEISRMGNKGYLYWGIRLQDLYEMLGVNIDEGVLSELVPEEMLRQVIDSRTRLIMAVLVFSLFIGWFLWDSFDDLGVMYAFVFLGPILLLTGWDLQIYRNLSERLRKRHKIN